LEKAKKKKALLLEELNTLTMITQKFLNLPISNGKN